MLLQDDRVVEPSEELFMMFNETLTPVLAAMVDMHEAHKDDDGGIVCKGAIG